VQEGQGQLPDLFPLNSLPEFFLSKITQSSSSSSWHVASSHSIPPLRFCRQNDLSSASSKASVTGIPVSQEIWWIQIMVGGRPRARLQSGDGRTPSWALQQVQRIWFTGILSRFPSCKDAAFCVRADAQTDTEYTETNSSLPSSTGTLFNALCGLPH